jgi:hypothetical protein
MLDAWLGAWATAGFALVSVVKAWHRHVKNNKLTAIASNVTLTIRVQSNDWRVAAVADLMAESW